MHPGHAVAGNAVVQLPEIPAFQNRFTDQRRFETKAEGMTAILAVGKLAAAVQIGVLARSDGAITEDKMNRRQRSVNRSGMREIQPIRFKRLQPVCRFRGRGQAKPGKMVEPAVTVHARPRVAVAAARPPAALYAND